MKSFEIADCSPPPYRPEHELRVIMREAIPRYLTQQLLPGVVHYGESVVDVTVSPTGECWILFNLSSAHARTFIRRASATSHRLPVRIPASIHMWYISSLQETLLWCTPQALPCRNGSCFGSQSVT